MLKYLLIPMLCFVSSCNILYQSIDAMDEIEFASMKQEIYLVTKIGVRKLCESRPELRSDFLAITEKVDAYLSGGGTHIAICMTDIKAKVLDQIKDVDIKDLVSLLLLRIERYGGLQFVNDVELGHVLTERSVELLQQIFKGFGDGAGL